MSPNSSGASPLLLKASMRRGGPPVAGSSTPLAVQRSEFEDFMNAYRPTLELPPREPPPQKPAEESKVDFGRSIKKLMKRPQGSPSLQGKNHRKEGIQRTTDVASGYQDTERYFSRDSKQQLERQKSKRPVSANIDSNLPLPPPTFGQGPTVLIPLDANLQKSDSVTPPAQSAPISPLARTPKTSVQQPTSSTGKSSKSSSQQGSAGSQTKTPKTPVQQPPGSPQPKLQKAKSIKNGPEEGGHKVPPDSASALSVTVPGASASQPKKKVSIQEEKRRSGTEVYPDSHCLILTGNNIGRFLPPHHVSIKN